MDNFNNSNSGSENLDEPIPFDKDPDKPIPFDDDDEDMKAGVSHSPLSLGGGGTVKMPTDEAAAQLLKPVTKKPVKKIASTDRITGVKTFFAKLHEGAIAFLDEQITNWLKDNPGVIIKQTDTATGIIAGKTSEPNIIITVWY